MLAPTPLLYYLAEDDNWVPKHVGVCICVTCILSRRTFVGKYVYFKTCAIRVTEN
jgi:hypothetical protein